MEDQLGDGTCMSSTATAYIGERHVCKRIDKFQNGLARFTKFLVNSDSTGENVKLKKKNVLNRDLFFALILRPHFEYRLVPLSTVLCHFVNRTAKIHVAT